MRATIVYGAGDVRVETVPDPVLRQPTDAIVRVVASCVCGSDLWPYGSMPPSDRGLPMGHEFLGVVEETGTAVSGCRPGDLVVAPFVWADNTCDVCREGLQTSCRHGGGWGVDGVDGGQGEAAWHRRAYMEELLPDVLEGNVEPGRVFDQTIGIEEVPAGYRAMADRQALKVLIRP